MCQPANNKAKNEGVYGVLPYMAPEVLRGYQYTKAADIYSFGIIMNELISEEIPFNDVPHDYILALKICKGLRPKISKNTPKLIASMITKCWDAKAENRPTVKELYHQLFRIWFNKEYADELKRKYCFKIEEFEKSGENKLKNGSNKNENKFKNNF